MRVKRHFRSFFLNLSKKGERLSYRAGRGKRSYHQSTIHIFEYLRAFKSFWNYRGVADSYKSDSDYFMIDAWSNASLIFTGKSVNF